MSDPLANLANVNLGFEPYVPPQIDLTQDEDEQEYKTPEPPPRAYKYRSPSALSPVNGKLKPIKERTQTRSVQMSGPYVVQLQALRAFDLDLRALTPHTRNEDMLDWTLIMYNVDSQQAIDWNELMLQSLLVHQFAVARAWSEIQLLHNATVDLTQLVYGDQARNVFIQLVQSFAQDVLICGGVKFMSPLSIQSLNARRQENLMFFAIARNALVRGSHMPLTAFDFEEEPDRVASKGFLELSQRTFKSRRYLFSKMVASACNRVWKLPERPQNYDMRFLLPADLYMHVQTACQSVVRRSRRAEYVDLLAHILDHPSLVHLTLLAHIASLELAQSLVIRGQNLKPYILDRITILRNFAADQIARELSI